MLAKVILSLVIIGMLVLSSWFLYQNIPGEPIALRGNFSSVNNTQINEVSMFYPNLRFRDNRISYYIDSSCSDLRRDKIIEALSIISDRTGSLSFYISNEESAEILAGCSRDYISPEENVFVVGDEGTSTPSLIVKGNGRIGIGTAGPAAMLHIAVSAGAANTVHAPIIMSRYWNSDADTRGAAMYSYYNSANSSDQLVFGVSGNAFSSLP